MTYLRDLESLVVKVKKVLSPIECAINIKDFDENYFKFSEKRTEAGRELPPYYLIYFLFVNLLGFKKSSGFDKVAWSIMIDYNGTAYALEHRKFGMGLFSSKSLDNEKECQEIVRKILHAVDLASPYFQKIASEAAKGSDMNVLNHSYRLLERYEFLVNLYTNKLSESLQKKIKKDATQSLTKQLNKYNVNSKFKRELEWLALSVIDAFFSFTEHVFVHIAILKGSLKTGEDVSDFTNDDWANKFKIAVTLENNHIKAHYDQLVLIKRNIRNYIAHGAFGKNGETFLIHTGAGAVPVNIPNKKGSRDFTFKRDLEYDEKQALEAIRRFMKYFWYSKATPEILYISSYLPTVLSYTTDGTYRNAMVSLEAMDKFVEFLSEKFDRAANMD